MHDDGSPLLFEAESGRFHAVAGRAVTTFGPDEPADVGLEGCLGDRALFQIESDHDKWFVRPLDSKTTVCVNKMPVVIRTPLQHRSILQVGQRVFVFVAHDDPAVSTAYSANLWLIDQLEEKPAAKLSVRDTMEFRIDQLQRLSESSVPLELPGAIELPERRLVIGRDTDSADICLPDVRVSRVHAWIQRSGEKATITDLKSANGTYVDGQPIRQPTEIGEGSHVQVGPYNLIFRATSLYPLSHDQNVELTGLNLVRRVPDRRNRGVLKVILDDVSLVIRPKEFVCILGPSGSGKTTLLSALSARVPADEGRVLLNGEDLYAHFEALKQNLALVPQRDVLHEALPLSVALWYTARLRLPTDMSSKDITSRIDETLESVNLLKNYITPIRRLSGGETKRASWANEAICNPSLIFLDEVTSGLDEQTDSDMMRLFRRLADDGKTIVCVTHSLSYVEQNCHLVVILAPGGVLAFVGPPEKALEYFEIPRLGDVYQKLKASSAGTWKERFRASPYYREFVESRLPDSATVSPEEQPPRRWQRGGWIAAWRQFILLTSRYVAIQWVDKRTLAMMCGQSLFIALLLIWLFGDLSSLSVETEARNLADLAAPGVPWEDLFEEMRDEVLAEAEEIKRADRSSKLLFLLCISCIWFGCNNAAKEIVKERTIYSKERDVGLNLISYYGSKVTLLGVLSVMQASLLFGLVRYFTNLGGDASHQWWLLALSSLTGVALGLAISAIANTEDVAVTVVPIVLIPQVVLAGLIAPLLNLTREFSQICVSSYWSYQGLLGTLGEPLQERLRDAEYLRLDDTWTPAMVSSVLALHVAAFAGVALVALRVRDSKDHRFLRIFARR